MGNQNYCRVAEPTRRWLSPTTGWPDPPVSNQGLLPGDWGPIPCDWGLLPGDWAYWWVTGSTSEEHCDLRSALFIRNPVPKLLFIGTADLSPLTFASCLRDLIPSASPSVPGPFYMLESESPGIFRIALHHIFGLKIQHRRHTYDRICIRRVEREWKEAVESIRKIRLTAISNSALPIIPRSELISILSVDESARRS